MIITRFIKYLPVVRLNPKKTFWHRLMQKNISHFNRITFKILRILKLKGAQVIGKSTMGNIVIKFSVDTPVALKNETIYIPKDFVIFESIINSGSWELDNCVYLAEAFKSGKNSDLNANTLLDIGANSGMVTIQTARLASNPITAYCIEPLPLNLEALRANLQIQTCLADYKIYPYALSQEDGIAQIYSEKVNIGNTSLFQMDKFQDTFNTEITLRNTNEFIKKEFSDSAIIALKCDTQGSEIIILSNFPTSFWNQIVRGIIEIRSMANLVPKQISQILKCLEIYDDFFWGDDFGKKIDLDDIENFWLKGTGEERDLFFSKNNF
jgi:FkbM family methyltransferase